MSPSQPRCLPTSKVSKVVLITTYLKTYLPADEDDAIDPRHIPPLLDELALERLVHALVRVRGWGWNRGWVRVGLGSCSGWGGKNVALTTTTTIYLATWLPTYLPTGLTWKRNLRECPCIARMPFIR